MKGPGGIQISVFGVTVESLSSQSKVWTGEKGHADASTKPSLSASGQFEWAVIVTVAVEKSDFQLEVRSSAGVELGRKPPGFGGFFGGGFP